MLANVERMVPPILSAHSAEAPWIVPSSISAAEAAWRFVACWVLPNFTRTAATRSSRLPSRTHSPCSRLHARLAGCITAPAGGLLPHRFTPDQPASPAAGMLSVAVVVERPLPGARPHLLFHGATFPNLLPGRAGVGKFLCRHSEPAATVFHSLHIGAPRPRLCTTNLPCNLSCSPPGCQRKQNISHREGRT